MAFTLELDGVTKAFDEFVAVDNLSFNIPEGEIFGLLGPNGAGKTSSIRMMIGITVPDSGAVRVFGQPLGRRLLDRVGYLPEERGLYKKMKIMENLVFLAQLKGIAVPEASRRAHAWLERLELAAGELEGRGALQGNAAKGAVHCRRHPRAGLHDPR